MNESNTAPKCAPPTGVLSLSRIAELYCDHHFPGMPNSMRPTPKRLPSTVEPFVRAIERELIAAWMPAPTMMQAVPILERLLATTVGERAEPVGPLMRNLTADDVQWVVNDNAELGVKIGNQFFFLYKGDSLQYDTGKHDDGVPMRWRPVGKREFGECCHPVKFWKDNTPLPRRYTDELAYTPGLSFGQPGDCDWRDLPAAPAAPEQAQAAERDLCTALLACPHTMDEQRVILYRDSTRAGGAYAQIADRLAEAFRKLAAPSAAQVPAGPVDNFDVIARLPDIHTALIQSFRAGVLRNEAQGIDAGAYAEAKRIMLAWDLPDAAPIAAAPAAPSLTDEEITELMSDIYLSDFYGKGTQAYDIAIVRAALAALAKKAPVAPAAPELDEVRNRALEAAARECEIRARNWGSFVDEPEYVAREDAGLTCAAAIRGMKTATNEGEAHAHE